MEADLGRPEGFFEEEGEELRLRVEKSIPFPSCQFRLGWRESTGLRASLQMLRL